MAPRSLRSHASLALFTALLASGCALDPSEPNPMGDDGGPVTPGADGGASVDAANPTDGGPIEPPLPGPGEAGAITATATFHSLGIVWRPDVPATDKTAPNVRYRKKGAPAWRSGAPLLFAYAIPDPKTHLRAPEFRGSLLELEPGATYEIELERNGSLVKALTATTWSETFPVLRTEKIASRTTPLVIDKGGSPSGYVVYEAEPNAVIDVGNAYDDCVTIKASYVIVRGFTLKGARKAGVELVDPNPNDQTPISDVVVEKNDISNWGRVASDGFGVDYDAAVGGYQSGTVARLIVQRNVIHAPRYDSNSWYERRSYINSKGNPECASQYSSPGVVNPSWNCHPEGPQAVAVADPIGNLVVRYNRVFSGNGNRYNDIFGLGANFSFHGFPGPDSDIYGNDLADSWDDGIESEGGNQNVRIWGNRINHTYTGVAIATVSLGPVYVFRNVRGDARISDVDPAGQPLADDSPKMALGPFLKTAPRRYSPSLDALVDEYTASSDAVDVSGPIRLFHNTVWQPTSPTVKNLAIGSSQGISAHQSLVRNVWTRNNLFVFARGTSHLAYPLSPSAPLLLPADTRNDFDYDVTNTSSAPTPAEIHGLFKVTPKFATTNGAGEFYVAPGTSGFDDGVVLPGMNDGWAGKAPDRGAFEAGGKALEFGENAYSK